MPALALRWRYFVSAFAFISFTTTLTPLRAAEIPVKRIVLYKHGIGFFERQGSVPEGEEARFDFKTTDMNDILKSLIITDAGGNAVAGIRYDSNETLDQKLNQFPFKIGDQESLSAFLDRLKGARIELTSGEHVLRGAILGARALEAGDEANRGLVREQVSVLLDSGEIASYDLASVRSLKFLDSQLQQELKQYLSTIAKSKFLNKRSVYVDSTQHGNRNLRVSYITSTAVWKSSYRLTLQDVSSTLEGWAIVDNTTGEDWDGVNLSVVSGRPISFVSLLDTPRYGQRQVAELPEDRAAGPEVYGGSIDGNPAAMAAGALGTGSGSGSGGGGIGGGVYEIGRYKNPVTVTKSEAVQLEQSARLQSSIVEGAMGASLGELFEYRFAGPVTIKKNQSAMLPFLQSKIAARKLLIYTEHDGEHPVNAAELTNNTSETLDGGPVTVYESGAYAGEALFETLKPNDKRLVGYAVDYGTRITTAFNTSRRTVREVHVKEGVLQLTYGERQTRTYTVRNVDNKAKALILQQEGVHDYAVLSPKPSERTASAYRFEVTLPANGSQTLKVEEERNYFNSTALSSSTPDLLLTIVENKELNGQSRRQLQAVLDLKSRLEDANRSLGIAKSNIEELNGDQTRLRQNIDSLNRVKGQEDQVRKYSAELSDNELQLAKLRDQVRDLSARASDLNANVKNAIEKLDF